MQTDRFRRAIAERALGWMAACCQAAAVIAWLLLVLRYQYGAEWLQTYDEANLDGLFLAAIAGAWVFRALSKRTAGQRLGFLLRLALVVGMTVMAVVGAEYAARFQFRQARTSGKAGDYVASSGVWSAGPNNSIGFRDREIPPKIEGRYRIAVVGDSFTWGAGIERGERFSDLLGQFLGPRYEVFNFGLPGNNMGGHLNVLETVLPLKPDFVLLQLYINDFETQYMRRPRSYPLLPQTLDSKLGQSSLLYNLMQTQWSRIQEGLGISEGYVQYMNRSLSDPNGQNSLEAFGQLKQFFVRTRTARVAVGVVLFPETDALGPNGTAYPFRYLHDGVRLACVDEQVRCLDLLPMFSTYADQRAIWVSPFDAHPNAAVNRRAAFEIQQAFSPGWQY